MRRRFPGSRSISIRLNGENYLVILERLSKEQPNSLAIRLHRSDDKPGEERVIQRVVDDIVAGLAAQLQGMFPRKEKP